MNIPQFKNKKLFDQAFTHRSFLNETTEKVSSNERMEFLGDSIISFVISGYLFSRYPQSNEGVLTNMRSLLVNTKSLAEVARELNLGEYLKLSKGEEDSKGRQNQSLLADSFEALVGALFLDSGIEQTKDFLMQVFSQRVQDLEKERSFKDPKSLLQEFIQSRKQTSPAYKVLKELGPAHSRVFTMGVFIGNKLFEEGKGKSKQEAEENAALKALEKLKRVTPLE
ncbi:MAG: Ribonuclease 3 [Candidatus Levybacteria bacterium GW2011_GWB1_35_5]|nr:MAG: Ribonuclease 3 [Candidatus Levybacteria bacterium GW2011_GWB1_35_5]